MDFFGIGMGEVLVILVVVLLVWGPGRVVEAGKTLGKITRAMKKTTFDLTAQLTREMEEEEKGKSPQQQSSSDTEAGQTATGERKHE